MSELKLFAQKCMRIFACIFVQPSTKIKVNKTPILAACLLLSNIATAGTMGAEEQPLLYNGLYLGLSIGASDLIDKESTANDLHHFSSTGIIGGGLVGYDHSIDQKLKLGLEWFMNANGMNVAAKQNYGNKPSYKANSRYTVGFHLLPGYEFNPGTVGHVLLGYAYNKFNISDNGNYGFINDQFKRSGFQCGLGAKTNLPKQFALRGDVVYTGYAPQTSYGISAEPPFLTQLYNNNFATVEASMTLLYKPQL